MPFGVQINEKRLSRPTKYTYTEHAERNAIYDAAKRGNRLDNTVMYCPWFACADCGRAIIQSGIKRVIGHQKMFDDTPERWAESIAAAFEMFNEAGVETLLVDPVAPDLRFNRQPDPWDLPEIRFNEVLWKP